MGRQRRVLTPDRSAVHRWGAQLRALRDERGLSLAGLSREAQLFSWLIQVLSRRDRCGKLATPGPDLCRRE